MPVNKQSKVKEMNGMECRSMPWSRASMLTPLFGECENLPSPKNWACQI